MNAAELFVRALEAEGVEYVFGVPGEENLDFLEALMTSRIRFITTRHEQSAAVMAATVGRLTGKVGVALSTLGPGATNLLTGVAYAQLGGMPLLVITGQKPIRKSKQGRFQILDVVRMMEPVTKSSAAIVSAERIPMAVRQAVRLAETERPGACHLELPEDVAQEPTTIQVPARIQDKVRRPGPDPKAIAEAVRLIQSAKHPLFLVAAGANRKRISKHLARLADLTKIPFVTTQLGKGVLPEASDLYLGTTALSDGDYVHCVLERSDCVIVIGHDLSEKPPVLLDGSTRTVIHINFSESQMDDVYAPTWDVVGDIAHTLWRLAEEIVPQPSWDFSYFERMGVLMRTQRMEKQDSGAFPLKPQRIVHELRNALPADGVLSLDNGMYKIWIARNYPALHQNTVLLDNALATMGAGLPVAVATKLLQPATKVVAVVGDGGFMMSAQELETAKRLGLDLVVVVVRDDGFGMIRWKQGDRPHVAPALGFGNPDFVAFAESFGVTGVRISAADEFGPALNAALDRKGITVIDCPIDYSENEAVFAKELREKTCEL